MILDQLLTDSDSVQKKHEETFAIKPVRLAEPFERLRLETEKSGKRPKVFMLKVGNPAWMTARAMFSGNFFACAGYEIINPPAAESLEEAIAKAGEASPDIVVICSSDDQYPLIAPEILKAFTNKAEIVVAGYPKDHIDQLKEAGIRHFIHIKSNLPDTLQEFNRMLL